MSVLTSRCHDRNSKKQRLLGDRYGVKTSSDVTGEITSFERHGSVSMSSDNDEGDINDNDDDEWVLWDMRSFIVKSNDDLRQEVCCLQLLEIFRQIFSDVGLKDDLWIQSYSIISTGASTGVVEVIPDAISLDALKKTPGFKSLSAHFEHTYWTSADRLATAKKNFVASLAAYSLACYLLSIKDRHNGNILLDAEGHLIHIDFGFILSMAPGGAFSLETAPFKLTEEMIDLLGGLDSIYFEQFVRAFTSGFLALRDNSETILATLSIMATNSTFPCFYGKDKDAILEKFRGRFRKELGIKDVIRVCLELITDSYAHYGTAQYDSFQWFTNGIMS